MATPPKGSPYVTHRPYGNANSPSAPVAQRPSHSNENAIDHIDVDAPDAVRQFVGMSILRGEGYMRRLNDDDLAKTSGRELRPTTWGERRNAKKLEKIATARRREQQFAYHLIDPDFAEIKGSGTTGHSATTPPKGDSATRRELKHFSKNEKREKKARAKITRLDKKYKRISGIDPSEV